MKIVKMGYEHIMSGINCQDYAVNDGNIKLIVDGCSSCENSDLGAKMFCQLFPKSGYDIQKTFNILKVLFDTDSDIKKNLFFTILMCKEFEDKFEVDVCGDGYIILQRHDGKFNFVEFDCDNTPPYYGYNLINDKSCLSLYQNGVKFIKYTFPKSEFKNVGVASDGIRYIVKSQLRNEFEQLLEQKEMRLKLFINRNIQTLKDDISIAL